MTFEEWAAPKPTGSRSWVWEDQKQAWHAAQKAMKERALRALDRQVDAIGKGLIHREDAKQVIHKLKVE